MGSMMQRGRAAKVQGRDLGTAERNVQNRRGRSRPSVRASSPTGTSGDVLDGAPIVPERSREVIEVRRGNVVFIRAGVPHWYRAEGKEPFEMLCLVPNAPDRIDVIKAGRKRGTEKGDVVTSFTS
jgi:hypothetical protein